VEECKVQRAERKEPGAGGAGELAIADCRLPIGGVICRKRRKGRCFGASANRFFGELGLAPLNAARTSQRDVPTTGGRAKLFSVLQMIFSWELYTGVGLGFDEG
jgi:hypothetical protein